MLLKHYFVEKIAHSSYILAGDNECAVVDPRRDVDFYIDEARKLGLRITHILETHLHADFVSGHVELAEKTGAKIFMPGVENASFQYIEVKEGYVFDMEDMRIKVVETPGHTPEHVSYVLSDLSRGEEPIGVFVGDTLFVGDVGRPDLFPDRAQELAEKLYDSLFNKLLKLPDYCEVYPAHGAGSLCGKSMAAKYTTTIGYEKKYNETLQIKDMDEFVKALTNDMPEVPDHFARSSAINGHGPLPLYKLPKMKTMTPAEFNEAYQDPNTIILDVRSYFSFGGLHVPGAYSIDSTGNLPIFAGWILPPEKNVLLVAETYSIASAASIWLKRVGIDNVTGFLQAGMHQWVVEGLPIDHIAQISPADLEDMMKEGNTVLIDGRDNNAYDEVHAEESVNIPAHELRTRYGELDDNKNIVVYCNSGGRSNMGISILKQKGFKNVYNLAGGMNGYLAYKGVL
ncbi:Glyoxylase, beta-lactamase superfamily II [Dethiosulfatibacter aminovorans DSM 17477]|uniref:Glyoxylase, beta-lactamase superfamily II n=1 Tax=Dethiosulfatibacter aminovorans DSM 17477 TaxID=1121476 RepID=A0A1M6C9X5_9FIRM|nr:MBL fold metallo-hydrolase [Dethiosulfatibacter aminovorans]SHI57809.1 Glyoxylase, beta-lactamase superfamily II [Dethiosulfatibacter aminovorans DSM 17477]